MATSKKSSPKAGMSLHKFVATGGKPKDYNKVNKTDQLKAGSKGKK